MNLFRTAALLAMLAVALSARGAAQEEDAPRYRNKVSGFVGVTLEAEEAAAFTLGIAYQRRLGGPFGVGVLVERAFGDSRFSLAAAGLIWQPLRRVSIYVAPGIEVSGADDETFFVLRIGANYDVELTERWSIGPNVDADFVGGRTVWVLGAEVGYSF